MSGHAAHDPPRLGQFTPVLGDPANDVRDRVGWRTYVDVSRSSGDRPAFGGAGRGRGD